MNYLTAAEWALKFYTNVIRVVNNNPVLNNQIARIGFTTIGAAYLLKKLIPHPQTLLSIVHTPFALGERYGKGSYVVISGGTDGLGKEFALQLAGWGFNLVIIARNQEKLDKTARDIRHKYPQTKIRTILVDYIDCYQPGFIENIEDQIKDLDVSILINNVGIYPVKYFTHMPVDEVRATVLLNTLSHSLMTKIVLPKLLSRKQKSAIINVSSFASEIKTPKIQLYSSTKAFIKYLSEGLRQEYPQLDILTLKPNLVATKLAGNPRPIGIVCTVQDAVSAALGALGKVDETYGHWKHRFTAWGFVNLPEFIQAKLIEATH